MSVHDRIASAASENAEIVHALAEVDYAPSALKQQSIYLKDLQKQLSETEKLIKDLSAKTSKEKKDHEKYSESTLRRFAYKAGGKKEKFEAKASKEEREYFDAIQDEQKAKSRRDMLTKNLEEANKTKAELEVAAKRHADMQAELDRLYNSIFGGPTPDFPEEDAKEDQVKRAGWDFNQIQQQLNVEAQAVDILNQAKAVMTRSLGFMNEALRASTMDMWGVGGGFADFAERSALQKAEAGVSQVQMLVSQAQRIQPHVQPIGTVNIAQGNLMSDILFDNIFTDVAFHEKIEKSTAELQRAAKNLDSQLSLAKNRKTQRQQEVSRSAGQLEAARKELERVRQETFERVAGSQQYSAPPPYQS